MPTQPRMNINERRKYRIIMQVRYLAGDKKERIGLLNEMQKSLDATARA